MQQPLISTTSLGRKAGSSSSNGQETGIIIVIAVDVDYSLILLGEARKEGPTGAFSLQW